MTKRRGKDDKGDIVNDKGVILIVDDEKEINLMLKGFFTALGYDTLTAFDGDEAMKIINSVTLDLILLDIRMPGVDGIQILKKVRKEKPMTKVIVMTAYREDVIEEVERIGIDGFFPKPIDFSRFIDRIRYVLKETRKSTRMYPTKEKKEPRIREVPKAKLLFLEPNPVIYGFTCGIFEAEGLIKAEYEIKVLYADRQEIEGLNYLYDYQPDIVIMYDSLFNIEDTKQLAGLIMNSSHRPKELILHGLIPKGEFELIELNKMDIKFCNQNTIKDDQIRLSNQILADFVAKMCVKHGLVKK